MESFDDERMRNLFEAFKKTDEFYDSFRKAFFKRMQNELENHQLESPDNDEDLRIILRTYVDKILSATESVFEKDTHYPPFRMKEELSFMEKLISKQDEKLMALGKPFHTKVKELIVHFFPQLTELSGDGLRLLEKNTLACNYDFSINFNYYLTRIKKQA